MSRGAPLAYLLLHYSAFHWTNWPINSAASLSFFPSILPSFLPFFMRVQLPSPSSSFISHSSHFQLLWLQKTYFNLSSSSFCTFWISCVIIFVRFPSVPGAWGWIFCPRFLLEELVNAAVTAPRRTPPPSPQSEIPPTSGTLNQISPLLLFTREQHLWGCSRPIRWAAGGQAGGWLIRSGPLGPQNEY